MRGLASSATSLRARLGSRSSGRYPKKRSEEMRSRGSSVRDLAGHLLRHRAVEGGELSQPTAFSGRAPNAGSRHTPTSATLSSNATSPTCTNIRRRSTPRCIQNIFDIIINILPLGVTMESVTTDCLPIPLPQLEPLKVLY